MIWGLFKGKWSSDEGNIGVVVRKAVMIVVRRPCQDEARSELLHLYMALHELSGPFGGRGAV